VTTAFPHSGSGGAGGPHAHRVIFIDLGRFLALVFMLYGHTVSALLAPQYLRGTWFDVWNFQRGLTSSLFLLLSGFAFSVATSRRWGSHQRLSPAFFRRVRRFALFLLLGYVIHLPVTRLSLLATLTDEQWRSLLQVDVLQLIGATFLMVQLLVLAVRSRRDFTVAVFVIAAAVLAVTHNVWAIDWWRLLPAWLAAYLSPERGSLFPLFPWATYVLFGAGLGQIYVGWGAAHLSRYATFALLVPGILLTSLGWGLAALENAPWGPDAWNFMPIQLAIRVGACLIILAAIAAASQRLARLPHFFAAVAQETLLIYFVHLCIVYGSIWNNGLAVYYAAALGPMATLLCVLLVLVSMAVLGWSWHWLKHADPRLSQWITAGVAALLVIQLL
jgi:uncharacterized membrane protein